MFATMLLDDASVLYGGVSAQAAPSIVKLQTQAFYVYMYEVNDKILAGQILDKILAEDCGACHIPHRMREG